MLHQLLRRNHKREQLVQQGGYFGWFDAAQSFNKNESRSSALPSYSTAAATAL